MHAVTIDEAKAQLVDLVEAAINGETVVIIIGSARGQIQMADDFDEPLTNFD